MKIIPVIDLKDGLVVSAQQGNRESYQPINSSLSKSSKIEDVLKVFLSLYPFETIYIADLNAITNSGNNQYLIDKLISNYTNIEFWIDNGIKLEDISAFAGLNYKLIIGSESQNNSSFQHLNQVLNNIILSLDYFPDQGFKGPDELLENSALWPNNIIIMTLERVGINSGPDFEKLTYFSEKNPSKNIIAAGGIRDEMDLLQLKKLGINHALIASALHSGKLTSQIINNLQTKKCPS